MKFFISSVAILGLSNAFYMPSSPNVESKAAVEIQKLFGMFESMQEQSTTDKRKDACYLNIFGNPNVAERTCPDGLESFNGECYEACKEGYKGFYGFCVPASSSLLMQAESHVPYKRKPVALEPVCARSNLIIENTCFAPVECPKNLPNKCGFLCLKDIKSCETFVSKAISLTVNLVTKIQSGDLLGATFALKDIYDFVTSFPPCQATKITKVFTEIFSVLRL